MPCQETSDAGWPSHVMNNPSAYPDVFVSIFLSLGLDTDHLEICSKVCKAWRDFIRGYLWQSERVMRYVDDKWSTGQPYITETATCRGEVRCFTGDDQILLCGLYNGNIEVWTKNLDSEENSESICDSPKKDRKINRLTTLKDGHRGSVFCIALNSDIVVSGSFDHSVCVWDRRKNFELLSRQEDRHGDMVYSIAVNELNQFISCSHDSTVCMWKYDRSTSEVSYVTSLSGHVSGVKAVDCDNIRAVTASRDRTLRQWSLASRTEINLIRLAGSPSCVSLLYPRVVVGLKSSFFGDGSDERHLVRVYDLEKSSCLRVMHGHEGRVLTVKMDPLSRRIVSADASGHLLIWPKLNLNNYKEVQNFDENEMPDNILALGSTKVAGLVTGLTGLEVAMQKGTVKALDFFG